MEVLQQVLTVSEAARLAHVTKWAILHHIESGRLLHRQSDRFYLICRESLAQIYPHVEKTPHEAVQAAV